MITPQNVSFCVPRNEKSDAGQERVNEFFDAIVNGVIITVICSALECKDAHLLLNSTLWERCSRPRWSSRWGREASGWAVLSGRSVSRGGTPEHKWERFHEVGQLLHEPPNHLTAQSQAMKSQRNKHKRKDVFLLHANQNVVISHKSGSANPTKPLLKETVTHTTLLKV